MRRCDVCPATLRVGSPEVAAMRPTLCGACGLREVKPKWVVGCKRLLLVAWLSSTLDGITPLFTPLRPEGLSGLALMTAKRRGSRGPGCSALCALCPPPWSPGKDPHSGGGRHFRMSEDAGQPMDRESGVHRAINSSTSARTFTGQKGACLSATDEL